MAKTVNDFWDEMSITHGTKSHGIYNMRELHLIPKVPGLYSWHLNTDLTNFDDYFKMFHQKKVKVKVSGSLKENYIGEVKRTYEEKSFISSKQTDKNLCEFASYIFCPPLYIGISQELGKRLRTHYSELEKIYSGVQKLPSISKIGQTQFDTIVESSHFAQRMGHSLNSFSRLSLNSLFIKTVELDPSYTWADLQRVEKYLNRTYVPMYGRK